VIGMARVGEEAIDGLGAAGGGRRGAEGANLCLGGDDADGIEGDAAEEGEVVGERGEL
jgi:hypothetical protein